MLSEIAPGVLMWSGAGTHGSPNATVLVDDDGLTVVDALLSPVQAAPLADACAQLGPPVRRLVVSSSHVEYVGGSSMFPLAAVFGTPQISAHLDQPLNADGCARLFPDHAHEFDELSTRPVSHTVAEPAWVSATGVAVPLAGELAENLAVQIPEQGVVACGALASFGTTPLLFDGHPQQWIESLDVLLGYGSVFIPGHGPPGGAPEIGDLRQYLAACVEAQGDVSRLGSGPWDAWHDRDYDEVNVERAAMLAAGDTSPPPSMLRLLGLS